MHIRVLNLGSCVNGHIACTLPEQFLGWFLSCSTWNGFVRDHERIEGIKWGMQAVQFPGGSTLAAAGMR
jgi:hypothetical protein